MHTDLDRLRSFFVQAVPTEPRYSDNERIPAHQLVIEPLIAAAVELRLIAGGTDPDLQRLAESLGSPRRGGISFDLSRQVLRRAEELWNATGGRRGDLILACDPARVHLPTVLRWCQGPFIWASEYQLLKGMTREGLRTSRNLAQKGRLVFIFPRSSGIQWMEVFATKPHLIAAYSAALEHCRNFKRYVEHNPGAADEIITDRPPYSTTV